MHSRLTDDTGKLIMRLALGVMILLHGISKLTNGVGFIEGALTSAGLPAVLAYGAYLGEVVGPILLILGLFGRIGAALIVINMLFAIGLSHLGGVLQINQFGGWQIELEGMYLFTAIALLLTGPGRFSINGR